MAEKIYDKASVLVGAGAEGTVTVFTSTDEEPRKLVSISTNNVTDLVDLLVYDEREKIADVPADVKSLTNLPLVFDRPINVGNQLKVGIRNGTGGALTPVFSVCTEVG